MIDYYDLPHLTSFITENYSFDGLDSLSLISIMIGDWLIWSSFSSNFYDKGLFIPVCNKFVFIKWINE